MKRNGRETYHMGNPVKISMVGGHGGGLSCEVVNLITVPRFLTASWLIGGVGWMSTGRSGSRL